MTLNNSSNILENIYLRIQLLFCSLPKIIIPYGRRFIRFLALPYCYFYLINWDECNKSKFKVIIDLLYIFFVLKYYPYNYSLCRLWEKNKTEWKYYYGSNYEPYQKKRLSKEVQKSEYNIIFDDKEVCYQICKSIEVPLPVQYGCLDPSEDYKLKIKQIIENASGEQLIVKPVRGSGGKNIVIVYKSNNSIIVKDKNELLDLSEFNLHSRSVVQGYLQQHGSLVHLSHAFSTIRIVTMLTKDGNVLIVGAFMRFGVKDSYVDNLSSGGIAVGVKIESGELNDVAYDFNSKSYRYHPDSGIMFSGITIPYWSDIVKLAKHVQCSINYYRLLGQDIGITENGPVIIEINPAHDNIALEQSYGPILKNQLVLNEFLRYGLLVNNSLFDVSYQG